MLFEVKSTALEASYEKAFEYIANPLTLPEWTNAFASVESDGRALMATPEGQVPITLRVLSNEVAGTIDWEMTFPDGSQGVGHSRLVKLSDSACAYSFVLTPPPVPLEMLEGALAEQSSVLEKELVVLKGIMAQ